jgi:hypothetical protein
VGELAAQEIQNTDLMAWVFATRSIGPFFAGRYVEAADLLARADAAAAAGSSARRRAWVAALLARARAASHDPVDSLEALERAYRLMDAITEPIHGTEFFDGPRLNAMAGATYLELRDADRAHSLLVEAFNHRPVSDAKGRALIALDLAECRSVIGELEEATRLVLEALGTANGALVRPIITRTYKVLQAMQRCGEPQAVRELEAHIRDIAEPLSLTQPIQQGPIPV